MGQDIFISSSYLAELCFLFSAAGKYLIRNPYREHIYAPLVDYHSQSITKVRNVL